ncbi:GRB2-related adapter protein-like [Labrus mixtus]|uniref:GRB2-related adapter protein-like n=1 Tax=Labrus mixtus TaxID=508554 RepID=UPI0029C0814C|nr:GRB2-related adapter protein-like [Labrus mixtus]XP_060909836.1 GRB2-related adapter protein-like [Labrus mixtus]
MEAMAKYDYEATVSDELSFRKGERLKILQTTGNWYKAERDGVEGIVPKNFINFHLPSWYQENCSRSDAQGQLMLQSVGAFIIRGSQNSAPGRFSISVRHAADVQHFKVLQDSSGQYYLWSEKFTSLNQLVEHYKNNSISLHSRIFLHEMQQQLSDKTSPPAPPLPPHCPPIPAPRQHKPSPKQQVRALYSFRAEEKDELSFNVGDVVQVLERPDPAWWRGQLRGKTGLFPSNYTVPL